MSQTPKRSAVVGGELVNLSVSQIVYYDADSDGCPRKWYRKYVLRDRPPCDKCGERGEHKPGCTAANAKGTEYHKDIETYLKTGRDVLSPRIRAGKHFMPQPGPDLLTEFEFTGEHLTIEGIPVNGKIDLAHNRGIVIDTDGGTRAEVLGKRIAEVLDWKTSGRLTSGRKRNGEVLPTFTKSSGQLADQIPMIGYGIAIAKVYPHISHVRLSHGYFQTQGATTADKRSIVVSLDTLNSKMQDRIIPLVREMRDAAREKEFLKIPANFDACGNFGGCPYTGECPRSPSQHLDQLFGKGATMSLLNRNKVNSPAPAQQVAQHAPPTLAASLSTPLVTPNAQAVQAEQQRLAQQQAQAMATQAAPVYQQPSPVQTFGYCAACGQPVTSYNASKLVDGSIKHIGCPAQPPQVVANDAPQSQPHLSAQQVPAEAVYAQQPQVQAAIAQHAALAAQTAPAGSPFGAQPSEPQGNAQPAPAKRTRTRKAAAQTVTHAAQPVAVDPGETRDGDELVIFVNVMIEGGDYQSLDSYLFRLADDLCQRSGAADLRCAPDESGLAFGKWKGALAAAIRATLPGPGSYLINVGDSELHAVLAETLREHADVYVRGVR
jgi:hypothetical protein